MSNLKRLPESSFSEPEAARYLGITISRLYQLLDQHVFTGGCQRPECIEFTSSDLLLLRYWNAQDPPTRSEVIKMPKRD